MYPFFNGSEYTGAPYMFPSQNNMMPWPYCFYPYQQNQFIPSNQNQYPMNEFEDRLEAINLEQLNKDQNIRPTTDINPEQRSSGASEKKKVKMHKKIKDSCYVPKKQTEPYQIINARYTTKNIESNVVNQVYSYLWNEQKSKDQIQRYFKNNKEKIHLYYEYFKIIKRSNKRYINKCFLLDLCNYQPGHLAYTKVVKNPKRLQFLSISQFTACIRYLVNLYLVKLCPLSIVTSKKMRKQIWLRHINKCRDIKRYIFEGEDIEENDQRNQEEQSQHENQQSQ